MKLLLSLWEFNLLWKLVTDKAKKAFEQNDIPFPKGYTKLIGYSLQEGASEFNLCLLINEDPNVKPYLAMESKKWKSGGKKKEAMLVPSHLYQLLKPLQEPDSLDQVVELWDIDQFIFFRYIGYDDYKSFREGQYKEHIFEGFYYSPVKESIDTFSFCFTIIHQHSGLNLASAVRLSVQNLTQIPISPFKSSLLHFGKPCMYSQIQDENYFINVLINNVPPVASFENLMAIQIMNGTMTAGGVSGQWFNTEFFLVKKEKLEPEKLLEIQRYLLLQRNNYKIATTPPAVSMQTDLQVNGVSVNKINAWSNKTFRILAHTPSGLVLQSRFRINNDYSATIEVMLEDKMVTFPCHVLLNNINEGRLVVFSSSDKHIFYTFTSIEYISVLKEKSIIKGAYCVADGKASTNPVGDRFVMAIDYSDFELKRYHSAEIKNHEVDSSDILMTTLIQTFKTSS